MDLVRRIEGLCVQDWIWKYFGLGLICGMIDGWRGFRVLRIVLNGEICGWFGEMDFYWKWLERFFVILNIYLLLWFFFWRQKILFVVEIQENWNGLVLIIMDLFRYWFMAAINDKCMLIID